MFDWLLQPVPGYAVSMNTGADLSTPFVVVVLVIAVLVLVGKKLLAK